MRCRTVEELTAVTVRVFDRTMIKTDRLGGPGLYGYIARPESSALSGVLILPTIFGVNDFACDYAKALAGAGLLAAVWDLNSGLPLISDYQECIKRARTLTDTTAGRLIAQWTDALLCDYGLTAIAVLGFCIGGRFALLQAAQDRRIVGCVAAYPSIESPRLPNQEMDAVAVAADIACPVAMLRPGHDHVTNPQTYDDLTRALLARPAHTTVQVFPEAEHGFMHRKTPEANAAATALASPQIIGFLNACMAG